MVSSSSSSTTKVNKGPQVFINFRGDELRTNFICHLETALRLIGINAYIDTHEVAGENLDKLFERIKESTVALAIISSRYTESNWCLNELVKIVECVEQDTLRVIPIFYKLDPTIVKRLDGDFGLQLWNLWRGDRRNRDDRILKWNEALQGVTNKFGLVSENCSNDAIFIRNIVKHVMNTIDLSREERRRNSQRERMAKYRKIFLMISPLLIYLCLSTLWTFLYCKFNQTDLM